MKKWIKFFIKHLKHTFCRHHWKVWESTHIICEKGGTLPYRRCSRCGRVEVFKGKRWHTIGWYDE